MAAFRLHLAAKHMPASAGRSWVEACYSAGAIATTNDQPRGR
jgi:hypothetical protein